MNIPRPEHPNPQFERKSWLNLNGEWYFEEDTGESGIDRKFYEREELNSKITVPFCPESELSGIGKKDFMRCVWYIKRFTVPSEYKDKNVILHFGAIDYESLIYINGKQACRHVGGYTSFSVDITKYLNDGENRITVCAKDDCRSFIAKGKQSSYYYSHDCDYTRTTGIWQTVWLEFVPKSYIKSIKYFPSIEQKNIVLEINAVGNADFTAVASYNGKEMGRVSVELKEGVTSLTMNLSELYLWEVGEGRLYDLDITYGEDKISSYFGMRNTKFANKRYYLNDKETFLVTVLDQGFYKKGIYTAETEQELYRDIDLSMAAGFNGARLHQKIFEKRFLYHCDKKGYMVFGEIGNWGLDCSDMSLLPAFINEWTEEIERDFNHPSIIGWCPLNETWDVHGRHQNDDFIRIAYNITKAIDKTRPCVGTSGNYQVASDIYDIHDYIQEKEQFENIYLSKTVEELCENYDKTHEAVSKYQRSLDYKELPIFVSEYGGIRWDLDGVGGWGYGNGPKTEEEFFERYEYLTKALIESPHVCGLCYTQLYDVEQEVNGLYTYERKPKFDMEKIKKINQYKKV
ncbi:MAG: beta-galactosidase [Clostridia bacterium]|nr:beta-galactosidase [Clostridia bacterium]